MKRLLIGLVTMVALTSCGGAVKEAQTPERQGQADVSGTRLAPAPVPRAPTRLRLDGIDAPVVRLHLTGSDLVPPADPTVVGWWGRKVGASRGVTLLTGHTVHTGGGDLDDLEEVPVGATATVSGVAYAVTSVRVISKEALAHQASSLFDQSGEHRLVIVTCEDYDPTTGDYGTNVVVVATPN